jgi:hypothetical protein
MSSFHVDGRVTIKLEYELAMRLGEFILNARTEDKQFVALGHKLLNLDEEEVPQNIIRSTGRILNGPDKEPNDESWSGWDNLQSEKPILPKTQIRMRSKYSKIK